MTSYQSHCRLLGLLLEDPDPGSHEGSTALNRHHHHQQSARMYSSGLLLLPRRLEAAERQSVPLPPRDMRLTAACTREPP